MFRHKNREGFTLAEALLAVVLLSMAAAGVLLPFAGGAVVRAEGSQRTLASKVASDLMEEIISENFDVIVSRYNLSEAEGQMKARARIDQRAGKPLINLEDAIYSDFSRSVSSAYVYVPQESGAEQSKFILVTIRVYHKGIEKVVLRRLITGVL